MGLIKELEVCGSTNTEAKAWAAEGAPDMSAVIARRQTAGRGRRGRDWDSNTGGLYMSVIVKKDVHDSPQRLTVAAALAVQNALLRAGAPCGIKWPNDIVCGDKKLCGILSELVTSCGVPFAVIGIGVNVDNSPPSSVGVSLSALGINTDRLHVAKSILSELTAVLYQSFDATLAQYRQRLCTLGREVTVLSVAEEYKAVALDVDRNGMLLVKREDGTLSAVMSGDVSIRAAE